MTSIFKKKQNNGSTIFFTLVYYITGKCDGLCQITCTHDGRKYERVAGLTLSRSVCLDHVVLCDDQDPYRSHENCLSHELGHLIMSYIPKSWTKKVGT